MPSMPHSLRFFNATTLLVTLGVVLALMAVTSQIMVWVPPHHVAIVMNDEESVSDRPALAGQTVFYKRMISTVPLTPTTVDVQNVDLVAADGRTLPRMNATVVYTLRGEGVPRLFFDLQKNQAQGPSITDGELRHEALGAHTVSDLTTWIMLRLASQSPSTDAVGSKAFVDAVQTGLMNVLNDQHPGTFESLHITLSQDGGHGSIRANDHPSQALAQGWNVPTTLASLGPVPTVVQQRHALDVMQERLNKNAVEIQNLREGARLRALWWFAM